MQHCNSSIILIHLIVIPLVIAVNDFRLSVQSCDAVSGACDVNGIGDNRYTPYAIEAGGFSQWAGDNDYDTLDAVRIGIYGSDASIEDIDIRFAIQVSAYVDGLDDNDANAGTLSYTPWASEGGGWSALSDSGADLIDGVRVKLETRSAPGLTLYNVKAGIQMTDGGTDMANAGSEEYTAYLNAENYSWSPWASDNNWWGPDSARISLSVELLCEAEPAQFIWEQLVTEEIGKPNVEASLSVNNATLTLNIAVDVDYLGASAADDNGYVYGTTYVIDFEDYDAHYDDIRKPGTCQNRADILSDTDWNDVWSYSATPNEDGQIGSDINYLSYPNAGLWDIDVSPYDNCNSIRYSTSLTWDALTQCSNYDGTKSYMNTADTADSITLSGTLYVNVVSPFADNGDFGFYRVYQLLSQPFQIIVSKTVYVLDSTGINLLTIDIIAVYKENQEDIFKLIVLTESAEYLELSRESLGELLLTFDADTDTGLTKTDFRVLETAQSNCLTNKNYICSQLWQVTADSVKCSSADSKYTDFSGTFGITFNAKCREDLSDDLKTYCDNWLSDHKSEIQDSGTGLVVLSADLMWKDEICDPVVFEVQFAAVMQFFQDSAFSAEVSDTHLYLVGEDSIYVRITTNYPSDHLAVFGTQLMNVWICTFDPLESPQDAEVGEGVGGCFSSNKDTGNFDGHDGHVYDVGNGVPLEGFALDTVSAVDSNVVQFSFVVPTSVVRDKLYVHAQIEISLTVGGRRRRILMDTRITNQIDHFVDKVGITQTPTKYPSPKIPYTLPRNAPFVVSLQSPWIIVIGGLLVFVLTVNIVFMSFMNCYNKRRTYTPIKLQDSEFDESSERD